MLKQRVKLKTIWRHLWPQMKEYKWYFLASFLMFGVGMILMRTTLPIQYKNIIDIVASSTDPVADFSRIVRILVTIVLIMISYNVVFRSADFLMVKAQSTTIKKLRVYVLEKIGGHSYRFFTDNFSGSLIAKAKRFISGFAAIHDTITFRFFMPLINIIAVFVVLYGEARIIALLFIGFLSLYMVFIAWYVKKKIPLDLELVAQDSKIMARFADLLNNIVAIKIFSKLKKERKSFDDMAEQEHIIRTKNWNFANVQYLLQSLILAVTEVVLLYVSFALWRDGQITVGTIVLIQIYLTTIFVMIWDLGRAVTEFINNYSDLAEMTEMIEQSHEVQDADSPEDIKLVTKDIEFIDVSFAYQDGAYVFDKFNLTIKEGEKIGLVGYSGAGKSTLVKLMLRFTDIQGGKILIGGQDISQVRQDDLREAISFIPQETILFHRTIAENISYPNEDATKKEIVEASKSAFAHDFIEVLGEKYETLVGERGLKLSGGERQRIAIARAMLKDAPILVMDEATSSLDSMSEDYIQKSFKNLMKGKTVLVIAHRLSTVKKMDRIIVLGPNGVEEDGKHEELLKKKGKYAKLWDHQSGGFIK